MGGIPMAKLLAARRIAAQIVARDGAAFLPVFERLEREVEMAKGRLATINRAREMAAPGSEVTA